jgi:LPXTG-site transpeptidase (sortase) family protein
VLILCIESLTIANINKDTEPVVTSYEEDISIDITNQKPKLIQVTEAEPTTEQIVEIPTTESTTEEEPIITEEVYMLSDDTPTITETDETFTVSFNSSSYTYYKSIGQTEIAFPTQGEKYADIIIPSIEVNTEVIKGSTQELVDTYDTVISGKASYCGTKKPVLICGHKTKSFSKLKYLVKGNYILVQTIYGGYLYQVTQTAVGTVNAENNNIVDESDNNLLSFDIETDRQLLQLYTCFDDALTGKQRVVVIAELIKGTEITTSEE